MMALARTQYALLNIARKDTGLTEGQYRAALARIAQVESAKNLDQAGFTAMMGMFEWLGFTPTQAQGKDFGKRAGMASFAQVELIRVLWREYTRGAYEGEAELNKWLLRTHKVSSLRFMSHDQARKAITGLKAMKKRAA